MNIKPSKDNREESPSMHNDLGTLILFSVSCCTGSLKVPHISQLISDLFHLLSSVHTVSSHDCIQINPSLHTTAYIKIHDSLKIQLPWRRSLCLIVTCHCLKLLTCLLYTFPIFPHFPTELPQEGK
jgi:hypothetical protein